MFNFLLACANASGASGMGCYDWPVIKQIIMLFSLILEYIYKFFDLIGFPKLAIVIVVFTLLIKLCLLPLTIQQQKFSKLTNIMQPELKKIQAKYKGKRDNYSMQMQQEETKAVYAKYGVSQTGGCLQTVIQMPIIIALYGAIRMLPTVLDALSVPLTKVVNILNDSGLDFSSIAKGLGDAATSVTNQIMTLYALPTKGWNAITDMLNSSQATQVVAAHNEMLTVNTLWGFDISQSPWNLLKGGGWGILAILLPIIAGVSQWLSFQLTQASSKDKVEIDPNDQQARTTKTMGLIMPLFSVWFCATMTCSLGIYWAASSLFQVVLQIFINKYYRKMDMDAFVEANLKKAEEKAKKKREKKGQKGETIARAANTSTKNIEKTTSTPLADRANVNAESIETKHVNSDLTPIANRAAMVQQYNEEHGIATNADGVKEKKKYKK